ncbi:hypothetical protein TNCV_475231 [Trichonephila clavipes]|nr:hypothetical protein TNCV_475231 [Trichonephila clavipes]
MNAALKRVGKCRGADAGGGIFQDDKAPNLAVGFVQSLFNAHEKKVKHIPCPALSPGLNIIEPFWYILGTSILNGYPPPERKGFDIIFSWVPGHVGILGNEQADNAARSMSDHMQHPVCHQDLKTSILKYIHHIYGKRLGINRSSTNCIAFILPLLIGQQ